MRTTVTLDPDVAAKLKAIARERGYLVQSSRGPLLRFPHLSAHSHV
jgi:hypothetical protein